jgi:hypothetical protein
MLTAVDTAPVQSFVTALLERNFEKLQRAFHEHVQFRALIPPGFRERDTAEGAREIVERWFGDSELIDAQYARVEALHDCVHAGYRVRVRENGAWYVCEQHLFAHTSEGVIDRLDVLCSGFRPLSLNYRSVSASSRLDCAMSRSPA